MPFGGIGGTTEAITTLMTWFLSYRAPGECAKKKSLAEWGIFDVERHVLNQGTDTLLFRTDAAVQPFAAEATIEIFKDDTRWFWGRITQTPCSYTATQELATYHVSGPAWYLEHLVFQQPWEYFRDETGQIEIVPRSLCLLGQDKDGTPVNARQCLQDIVTYAQNHGAPIACGEIVGFDFTFPCETVRDCSCAEALIKILRWTPDAVVWFDYATPQPTLRMVRADRLGTTTVSLSKCSQFQMVPRNDLQIKAVVLKYEHSHSCAGESWKTITTDAYPNKEAGEDFNALVLTIELEGTHSHIQEQYVETKPIRTDSIAWWKEHFPCLSETADKDIQISNVCCSTNLKNELVKGAVAPWMGCRAEYGTITADVSYLTADSLIENRTFSLKLCATDAVSKTYRKSIFISEGTEPPKNLAKVIYDATHCLRYEGQLRLECEELSTSFMGKTLGFSDGHLEWSTLKLPVQEERLFLDSGTVQLKFGAPKQLGPNDLCQLMHTHRMRTIAEDTNARFVAKRSGSTKTYFPHMTPLVNSMIDRGHCKQLTIRDKDKKVILNAAALPEKTEIKLREFAIVENGELKTVWIPSS